MSTDTDNTKANAYNDFHLQYIAGEWQSGQDDSVNTNTNPYNGDTLVKIQQATEAQLNEAYQAASAAQKEWAQQTPATRAGVLYKVVEILDQRQDEIVDWLIKESGSTVLKPWLSLLLPAPLPLRLRLSPVVYMARFVHLTPLVKKTLFTVSPSVSSLSLVRGTFHYI